MTHTTRRVVALAFAAAVGLLAGGCDDPWGAMCQAELDYYGPLCAKEGAGSEACAWMDQHATVAGTCH